MVQCVDVGGSFMKFGVSQRPGEVRPLRKHPTPLEDFDAFAQAVAEGFPPGPDHPLALALPGVVDPETGVVTCANVPCLDGRAVAADLGRRLGRRVFLANDADCFALAEAHAGAGRGHRIVFGIILGTGVGGGLVVDGRILVGTGGLTGEWGHGPVVTEPAFACGCGQRGCLNTVGGARGLERLYEHAHGQRRDSVDIVQGWREGDPRARHAVEQCVRLLAGPLAMVINVVGASSVPAGGGLAKSREFVALLDQEVRKRILRATDGPLVVPAALPGDPGLVGAGLLGWDA